MNAGHAGGPRPIRALLVDPSLYTAPYDAALTEGLLAAGVDPTWATRPIRAGEREEVPARYVDAFFYKRTDGLQRLPGPVRGVSKGFAHAFGLARLVAKVWRHAPDVVHVQWVLLPPFDLVALWLIKRRCRVVLTVHDTTPFNGARLSWLQEAGFDAPIRLADAVIVHTRAARERLLARGLDPRKVTVIPHGPLALAASPPAPRAPRDPRWTFVLFGEIKPYKGADLLVEAIARLAPALRARCRVVIAGRPMMDLAPLAERTAALGLAGTVELRLRRLSEPEMAALFEEADSFVFPYRQIDASGVYFLVKSLGKWLIASRVGAFAEDLAEGVEGALVPVADVAALAQALEQAVLTRPVGAATRPAECWQRIGRATAALYVAQPAAGGA